jgi:cell division protease FtsH
VIPDDITAIYSFHSCAQIKSVINHAAIKAAYEGHDEINIGDFINASVNPESEEDSNSVNHEKYRREIAYHEAGHLLVAEACVKGSIGFVCTKRSRTVEGVCHLRDNLTRRPYIVLAELGGKAAVETKFGWLASGADEDMQEAGRDIINGMFDSGTGGFSLLRFELSDSPAFGGKDGSSAVTYELERHFHKAKELIALNMPFLDAAAEELMKKGYLLASEIKALEQKYPIDSSPIKEI